MSYNSDLEPNRDLEEKIIQLRIDSLMEHLWFIYNQDESIIKVKLRNKKLPEDFKSFVDKVLKSGSSLNRFSNENDIFKTTHQELKKIDPYHDNQEYKPLLTPQNSGIDSNTLDIYIKSIQDILNEPKGLFYKILQFLGIKDKKKYEKIRENWQQNLHSLMNRVQAEVDLQPAGNYTIGRTTFSSQGAHQAAQRKAELKAEKDAKHRIELENAETLKRTDLSGEEQSSSEKLQQEIEKSAMAIKLQDFVNSMGGTASLQSFETVDKIIVHITSLLQQRAKKIKTELQNADKYDLNHVYSQEQATLAQMAKDERVSRQRYLPPEQVSSKIKDGLADMDKVVQACESLKLRNSLQSVTVDSRSQIQFDKLSPAEMLASLEQSVVSLKSSEDLLAKVKKGQAKKIINEKWPQCKQKISGMLEVLVVQAGKLDGNGDLHNRAKRSNIEVYISNLNRLNHLSLYDIDDAELRTFLDILTQALEGGDLHHLVAFERDHKAKFPDYQTLTELKDSLQMFYNDFHKYSPEYSKTESQAMDRQAERRHSQILEDRVRRSSTPQDDFPEASSSAVKPRELKNPPHKP